MQKDTMRNSFVSKQRKTAKPISSAPDEQGIALVMTLMMGVILVTGATGLLVRQLSAKKLASSESYQQMAEAAASNGFNRILAVLNNASTTEYLGHLFTEPNNPNNNWNWQNPYSKGEYCSGMSELPQYADADGKLDNLPWPASTAGYLLNNTTLRGDNKGQVLTTYRLRSYNSTFSNGQGTGTFEVEGFVRRYVNDGKSPLLARARLTRSLQLESTIARPDDWGVIAVQFSNALDGTSERSVNIDGPGKFVWYTANALQSNCSRIYNNGTNIPGQPTESPVWPILRDNNTPYIPASNIYAIEGSSIDSVKKNGNPFTRIWAFDDSNPSCEHVVCVRPSSSIGESIAEITQNPSIINAEAAMNTELAETELSKYKTIRRHSEYNAFQIGTCKNTNDPENDCRSEDLQSDHWQWSFWKWWVHNIPGNSITRWRKTSSNTIEVGTCTKDRAVDCNLDNDAWDWEEEVSESNNSSSEENLTSSITVVKIDAEDICKDANARVCHLYLQKINLNDTHVFIKNDIQAVVLHLNVDDSVSQGNEIYKLGANSKLCGVNSLVGEPECNLDPVRFVITQDGNSERQSCPTEADAEDFQFAGQSLPAAWVSMNTGRVHAENVSMKGAIWASSLCSEGVLAVSTADDESAYVDEFKTYWNFSNTEGIGRRIVRGIRGSGFDIFKRW